MKNYQIVEGKKTKELAVRLTSKPFQGMIIKFGKVGIKDMGTHAKLAFDFDVIKGTLPKRKTSMKLLENTLGSRPQTGSAKSHRAHRSGTERLNIPCSSLHVQLLYSYC